MATENKRMRQLQATDAEWSSTDPTLLDGEIALSSDTMAFKVGPGQWSSLDYWGTPAEAQRVVRVSAVAGTGTAYTGTSDVPVDNLEDGDRRILMFNPNVDSVGDTVTLALNGDASPGAIRNAAGNPLYGGQLQAGNQYLLATYSSGAEYRVIGEGDWLDVVMTRLSGSGGTGAAYTATAGYSGDWADHWSQMVIFVPTLDNTVTQPTLSINGGTPVIIGASGTGNLEVGEMVGGHPYVLYWAGDDRWRLLVDKASVGLGNVSDTAPADLPLSNDTITALNPLNMRFFDSASSSGKMSVTVGPTNGLTLEWPDIRVQHPQGVRQLKASLAPVYVGPDEGLTIDLTGTYDIAGYDAVVENMAPGDYAAEQRGEKLILVHVRINTFSGAMDWMLSRALASDDYLKVTSNLADLNSVTQAKINLGLDNVDNTRDQDKIVSDPTQTALNLKTDNTTFNAHATENVAAFKQVNMLLFDEEANSRVTVVEGPGNGMTLDWLEMDIQHPDGMRVLKASTGPVEVAPNWGLIVDLTLPYVDGYTAEYIQMSSVHYTNAAEGKTWIVYHQRDNEFVGAMAHIVSRQLILGDTFSIQKNLSEVLSPATARANLGITEPKDLPLSDLDVQALKQVNMRLFDDLDDSKITVSEGPGTSMTIEWEDMDVMHPEGMSVLKASAGAFVVPINQGLIVDLTAPYGDGYVGYLSSMHATIFTDVMEGKKWVLHHQRTDEYIGAFAPYISRQLDPVSGEAIKQLNIELFDEEANSRITVVEGPGNGLTLEWDEMDLQHPDGMRVLKASTGPVEVAPNFGLVVDLTLPYVDGYTATIDAMSAGVYTAEAHGDLWIVHHQRANQFTGAFADIITRQLVLGDVLKVNQNLADLEDPQDAMVNLKIIEVIERPDYHTANTTPGTTNMTDALVATLGTQRQTYLDSSRYLVTTADGGGAIEMADAAHLFGVGGADIQWVPDPTGTSKLLNSETRNIIENVKFEITGAAAEGITGIFVDPGNDMSINNCHFDGGITDDGLTQSHNCHVVSFSNENVDNFMSRGNLYESINRVFLNSNTGAGTITNITYADDVIRDCYAEALAINTPAAVAIGFSVYNLRSENMKVLGGVTNHVIGGAKVHGIGVWGNWHYGTGGGHVHFEQGTKQARVFGNGGYFTAGKTGFFAADNDVSGEVSAVEQVAVIGNTWETEQQLAESQGLDLAPNNKGIEPLKLSTLIGNVLKGWEKGIRTAEKLMLNLVTGNIFTGSLIGMQVMRPSLMLHDNLLIDNTTNVLFKTGGFVGHQYIASEATDWDGTSPLVPIPGAADDAGGAGLMGWTTETRPATVAMGQVDWKIMPIGLFMSGEMHLSIWRSATFWARAHSKVTWDGGSLVTETLLSASAGISFLDWQVTDGMLALRLDMSSAQSNVRFQIKFDGMHVVA